MGRPVTCLMPPPYDTQHATYMATYLATGKSKILGRRRQRLEVSAKYAGLPRASEATLQHRQRGELVAPLSLHVLAATYLPPA